MTDTGPFYKIKPFFPIRGQLFLLVSAIKRPIPKRDRIYALTVYCSFIFNDPTNVSLTAKKVNASDILDFKEWWPGIYTKSLNPIEIAPSPRTNRKQYSYTKFHYF
jgi:hypothetical protein